MSPALCRGFVGFSQKWRTWTTLAWKVDTQNGKRHESLERVIGIGPFICLHVGTCFIHGKQKKLKDLNGKRNCSCSFHTVVFLKLLSCSGRSNSVTIFNMILITLFWRAACVCLFFIRKRRGRTQGGVRRANIGSDFNTFENDTGHILFQDSVYSGSTIWWCLCDRSRFSGYLYNAQ